MFRWIQICNMGPVADYLQKRGHTDDLLRFIQGISPVRNKNTNPKTLEEAVKKLQTVHDSIPSSQTDVKTHSAVLLSVAREYYNEAKKPKVYTP